MNKTRLLSNLGSVLEWYDFSLYGFLAPLWAQLYFPSAAPSIALIKAFATFAVGFVARPIGAILFGYVGDKYGRARSLKLTPLLITIPTVCIALLPSYQQIGVFASALFVLFRIAQGLVIGGEYANNIVYSCETSRIKHRYFFGSLSSCAASSGILLASLIVTALHHFLSPASLSTWGWRAAFMLSAFLGIVTAYFRKNLPETPIYDQLAHKTPKPLRDSWQLQWRDYLLGAALAWLPATAFYFVFLFLPNYLTTVLHVNPTAALGNNTSLLSMRLLVIPCLGCLADRIGGIYIARLASILFMVLSIPLFYAVHSHSSVIMNTAIALLAFLTTLNAATTPSLLVELLPAKTRCTILSFTLNISFGFAGGIVPLVGFLLSQSLQSKIAPACYLAITAIGTFIATLFFQKRQELYVKELTVLTHSHP